MTLVCEWPLYGIAESRLTLDGDVLRAAVARAQPVWPDEPPRSHLSLEHRVRLVGPDGNERRPSLPAPHGTPRRLAPIDRHLTRPR